MTIRVRSANENNLQAIDVEFEAGLTVVTGVSGSGKTSLVFDTLYHEARRRFLEVFALGSVAGRPSPADVRSISGLGPAVAVGQNLLNRNPNSTLATASGLHPFLRLLYARFGRRACAACSTTLTLLTADEGIERLLSAAASTGVTVLAPLLRGAQGSHTTLLQALSQAFGSEAVLVDGRALTPGALLDAAVPHDIDLIAGRLEPTSPAAEAHDLFEGVQSLGATALVLQSAGRRKTLSFTPVCPNCGAWFVDLEPTHFHRPCWNCHGQGCDRCAGTGLHPEAAAVRWQGYRLPDLLALPVSRVRDLFVAADLPSSAGRLLSEISRRLDSLQAVGLGYVSLDRPSPSLSRGEAQRVRLAVALTSELEDMLHVLDEPTIGQHPADVARLLPVFRALPGPVIYVEHDPLAAAAADWALDLGPGAGSQGGLLLYSGSPAGLWQAETPTGRFFSGRVQPAIPAPRKKPEAFLQLRQVELRNLAGFDLAVPIGRLTAVTGVSGSGKSTLVEDVLVASLTRQEPAGCRVLEGPLLKPILVDQEPIGRNPRSNPATYTKLADVIRDLFAAGSGLSPSHFSFNRPEGACPACGGMGAVEVKMRYLPSSWIRCSACDGRRFADAILETRINLNGRPFSIADVYELSVSEALPLLVVSRDLPAAARKRARRLLKALRDIGLGYLPLGQPSPTLSGGEAQRVKLAKFLGRPSLAGRLLVLDEPTTGLHPQDVGGLLLVLDRLVRAGGTVVVVEHNLAFIRAADWIVDLGPGAGPEGGRLLYAGPAAGLSQVDGSPTAAALAQEEAVRPRAAAGPAPSRRSDVIAIRQATVHNLQAVDVDIPKNALTVVTGLSGSGKSSLVSDVLEAEARRRFLETLSLYERQGTREGPQAQVEAVRGLGVALSVGPDRRLSDARATVGTATEISHHLAALLAWQGCRLCPNCGQTMARRAGAGRPGTGGSDWICPSCDRRLPGVEPRHFSPHTYAAACQRCAGVGTLQVPKPEKLIVDPQKPLCDGAMYSPGFFPKGFLCKPFNSGYDMVRALGERYDFDPAETPWQQMSPAAQKAFLFGDPEPLSVHFHSRSQRYTRSVTFPGFYGWIRDWDVGGTYTESQSCPECQGAKLRPAYLAVTLAGYNIHQLSQMPLVDLAAALTSLDGEGGQREGEAGPELTGAALETIRRRLSFLIQVGLGYLHLDRTAGSLSAGEAQRIKLAGLLGSGLTSLTILLDEPSRGLHPAEVAALRQALLALRDEGNTVVVVEHDLELIRGADRLIDMGPGSGPQGGRIVAQGSPEEVALGDTATAAWLRGQRRLKLPPERRRPLNWLTVRAPRANNLAGQDISLPLGLLAGLCGVSGSGKSTLLIDTVGRALAPKKYTTSVAYEPVNPGLHQAIEGAPVRTVQVDQARAGVISPAAFLGLTAPLRRLYAGCEAAQALGLSDKAFSQSCSACSGRGVVRTDMGFLPPILAQCETCRGSGYPAEAWEARLNDVSLPELGEMTLDQVAGLFGDEPGLARPLAAARQVGLGYLVLQQPGYALSGGEAQRLKIARELCRKTKDKTLYLLDEPTVGQHLDDVQRLSGVLGGLVEAGHSVILIEHHPHLLAACDYLVELGPGGGPDGGRVIASGPPEKLAAGQTPIAPYLREVLEVYP